MFFLYSDFPGPLIRSRRFRNTHGFHIRSHIENACKHRQINWIINTQTYKQTNNVYILTREYTPWPTPAYSCDPKLYTDITKQLQCSGRMLIVPGMTECLCLHTLFVHVCRSRLNWLRVLCKDNTLYPWLTSQRIGTSSILFHAFILGSPVQRRKSRFEPDMTHILSSILVLFETRVTFSN